MLKTTLITGSTLVRAIKLFRERSHFETPKTRCCPRFGDQRTTTNIPEKEKRMIFSLGLKSSPAMLYNWPHETTLLQMESWSWKGQFEHLDRGWFCRWLKNSFQLSFLGMCGYVLSSNHFEGSFWEMGGGVFVIVVGWYPFRCFFRTFDDCN